MTARKRAAKKKNARARGMKGMPDFPVTLQEFSDRMRKMLSNLEREIEQAFPTARRRLARQLREASHELGRLEERGERAWKRSAGAATRDTQRILNRLSVTIEKLDLTRGGKKKSVKKKSVKKKAAKKKRAAKKKAARK